MPRRTNKVKALKGRIALTQGGWGEKSGDHEPAWKKRRRTGRSEIYDGAPPRNPYSRTKGAPPRNPYSRTKGAPPRNPYSRTKGAPPRNPYSRTKGAPPRNSYGTITGDKLNDLIFGDGVYGGLESIVNSSKGVVGSEENRTYRSGLGKFKSAIGGESNSYIAKNRRAYSNKKRKKQKK